MAVFVDKYHKVYYFAIIIEHIRNCRWKTGAHILAVVSLAEISSSSSLTPVCRSLGLPLEVSHGGQFHVAWVCFMSVPLYYSTHLCSPCHSYPFRLTVFISHHPRPFIFTNYTNSPLHSTCCFFQWFVHFTPHLLTAHSDGPAHFSIVFERHLPVFASRFSRVCSLQVLLWPLSWTVIASWSGDIL